MKNVFFYKSDINFLSLPGFLYKMGLCQLDT